MNKTLFSLLILITSSLVLCSSKDGSSPRSPRASKTKSPVNFADNSNFSPIIKKKKKAVSINDQESFYEYDEIGNEKNDNLNKETLEFDQKSMQSIEHLPLFLSIPEMLPRPILKRRGIFKKYPNILQLLSESTPQELKGEFYEDGVQLPMNNNFNILKQLFDLEKSTEVFNFLTDSYHKNQVDAKLKIIYKHDKSLFMSNLLEIDFVIDELVLIRLFEIMFNGGDEDKEILLDLKSEFNQPTIKAKLFLHAVYFEISIIYKVFVELLESPDNSWKLQLARAILIRYNTQSMIQLELMPLMIYAVKNDSEESVRMMMDFEASEANRLDSFGCSPIYYAAYHGRLDLLELFKERRVEINGKGPLIGAACDDRDESLKWFLIDQVQVKADKDNQKFQYKFTIKDIEDAALAAAKHGHSGIIKFFLKNKITEFNLHFHQGSDTLLSVALKNDRIGFVTRLVDVFKFDVNFSGDDPINPNGHALTFLLEKPSIMEYFLKKGAKRNVLVPAKSSNSEYIELAKYVETCENEQLIKIFNKYNCI